MLKLIPPAPIQPTTQPTGLAVTGRDLVALALSVPAFHVVSLLLMFLLALAVAPANRGEQVQMLAIMCVGVIHPKWLLALTLLSHHR